ncbi:hypothetical protein PC120_g10684 [Phytophthora cactorum]|nr:hypothetical protein PC120_g10684 [Phytophthora cactorum]
MKLSHKKELGAWIPMRDDVSVLKMNGELDHGRLHEWLDEMSDSTIPLENEDELHIGTKEPEARSLVTKLMRVYRKLTSNTGDCPPATALPVQHHIDTGTEAPIMLKRRHQAQTEDKIVEDNVGKMLNAGVIEEGNGAGGFPVVLVRKKDAEVRFCVDYRALNNITKKDEYPLPRIDETLEALGEDRDKTALTTKQGLYRFVWMTFGLPNALSTFQRMLNGVLRGLTWLICLVYLDDIVVFTHGGIEQHVLEVACVLERLSAAGLTLKLKKCMFAADSMEYLGHELSNEGVRPLERLVSADLEGAFEQIKIVLTRKPILVYPDFRLPFRVVTDASTVGLMQGKDDGWKPVAYGSKVNSETEGKYGITELECLAVV